MSVVGLKSLDASPCNKLLLLPVIIKNSLAWEYFFTHKSTFAVYYRTGSPGQLGLRSLDSRVTGSLGHKMWPSSISGADCGTGSPRDSTGKNGLVTRSCRCFLVAITRSSVHTSYRASVPTASPDRTTTRSRGQRQSSYSTIEYWVFIEQHVTNVRADHDFKAVA